MAAEHETITDFFGKEYVVVPKFGPIPCEGGGWGCYDKYTRSYEGGV